MFEAFEQYLKHDLANISREQAVQMYQAAIVQQVPRKQLLVRAGEVYRYKILVLKGLLRNYAIAEDGAEHILKFTAAYDWTADTESYNKGSPASYYIQAIEPAVIMLWSQEKFERLQAEVPAINRFAEQIIMQRISEVQKRILANISYSAEAKYQNFIAAYPDIHQRVPLHMVASYLGVSRETLTRIRHAQLAQERSVS